MTSETDRPDLMLVFDLDGVVTDLESHDPDDSTLSIIAEDLKAGFPVAFITGRALGWIRERILARLEKLCNSSSLDNLVIVTEKGAITITRENGELKIDYDKRLALPDQFRKDAKKVLYKERKDGPLSEKMFWDETKQIIVSIEKRPGVSQSEFAAAREVLVRELEQLLEKSGLGQFKIDTTTLGTDVEHITAGKHKGAEDVLDWLEERGIKPASFAVFGDSQSDSAIAETLSGGGTDTTFVFVGDPESFKADEGAAYRTVITGGGYDKDASEYLKDLKDV